MDERIFVLLITLVHLTFFASRNTLFFIFLFFQINSVTRAAGYVIIIAYDIFCMLV